MVKSRSLIQHSAPPVDIAPLPLSPTPHPKTPPPEIVPLRVQQIKTIEILKPSFLRAYKENQVDEYFTRAAKLWCERFPEPEQEITTRAYKDDPDYLTFVAKLRKEWLKRRIFWLTFIFPQTKRGSPPLKLTWVRLMDQAERLIRKEMPLQQMGGYDRLIAYLNGDLDAYNL